MIYAYSFKLKITNLRLICGFFCGDLLEKTKFISSKLTQMKAQMKAQIF